MLFGIERISTEKIPTVGVPASYHPLIPFPAVSAQTLEMLLHKPFCFVPVLKHRRKLLQQLCLATLAFALDLFKPLLELLQFLAFFGFLPLSSPACKGVPYAVSLSNDSRHSKSLPQKGSSFTSPHKRRSPCFHTPFCLVFLQILVLRLKNLHEKKGIAQKREMLLGFFLLCYALEDNDPAPTLPLGVTARFFSARFNLLGIASRLLCSCLTYSIKS